MGKPFLIQGAAAGYGVRVWIVGVGLQSEARTIMDPLSSWGGPDKRLQDQRGYTYTSVMLSWECRDENLSIIRTKLTEAGYVEVASQEEKMKLFKEHPYSF